MGGVVVVTVRPGVQFVPDAAKAFQRAEAEVQAKRGRNIDVNSTYRSWAKQLKMFNDWNAYVNGTGPKPSHSKAVHPSASFHVSGLALDSDDWTDPWIVGVLAQNGFIRNRLYVPGENHHFEYIRAQDKNYGKDIDMPLTAEDKKWLRETLGWERKSVVNGLSFGDMLRAVYDSVRYGKKGVRTHGAGMNDLLTRLGALQLQVEAQSVAIEALAKAQGADPAAILKAVRDGVGKAMDKLEVTLSVDSTD